MTMPGFNGTGPRGFGPGTGRGLGPCGAGQARGFGRGRGFCWWRRPLAGKIMSRREERSLLEQEEQTLQEELEGIKKRKEELTQDSAE